MKLVVWNCRMALHEKWDALVAMGPDIAVVPEAASPDLPWMAEKVGKARSHA